MNQSVREAKAPKQCQVRKKKRSRLRSKRGKTCTCNGSHDWIEKGGGGGGWTMLLFAVILTLIETKHGTNGLSLGTP